MINLMEELEKLMQEKPLPYGRKPILMKYENNGRYQKVLILCSPKSIVWKNLYRDESEMGCYVLENDSWVNYQLGYILGCRKIKFVKAIPKVPFNATHDERWIFSIKNDYNTLLEYGDDVLKGELDWTKETRYPPLPVRYPSDIYAAFQKK